MNLSEKIKFIYFDVKDVLLSVDKPSSQLCADELGLSVDEYLAAFRAVEESMPKDMKQFLRDFTTYEEQQIYFHKFFKLLCDHLKIEDNGTVKRLVEHRSTAQYSLKGEVIETLEYLKDKYRLGVLTNALPSRRFNELKIQNIDKYFDPIIISKEVKHSKPNSLIYKIAIEQSGFKPEEILFLDDKIRNLDAAKYMKFGEVIHVRTVENTDKYLSIESIKELREIL